jgi:hypothetical protein
MFTNFKKMLGEKVKKSTEEHSRNATPFSNILMKVAPQAEKEAFTKDVVTSSFKNTGIFPFDKDLIIRRAKLNTSTISKDTIDEVQSIEDKARMATMLILETNKQKSVTKNVKSRVTKNSIYTPQQLFKFEEEKQIKKEKQQKDKEVKVQLKEENKKRKLEEKEEKIVMKKQKAEKKAQQVEEKKHKKIVNSCKGCNTIWKGSPNWMGCEHCEEYWVCPYCAKYKPLLKDHETDCGKQVED